LFHETNLDGVVTYEDVIGGRTFRKKKRYRVKLKWIRQAGTHAHMILENGRLSKKSWGVTNTPENPAVGTVG